MLESTYGTYFTRYLSLSYLQIGSCFSVLCFALLYRVFQGQDISSIHCICHQLRLSTLHKSSFRNCCDIYGRPNKLLRC
ncbi:hypothetical protein DL95DRAFT_380448 [Leptodontidium sp. 2 PMI_412]|nr:hypothetical protein DL95DRAFT_380448 [Leptodontidium sp. 2 PMI_412]